MRDSESGLAPRDRERHPAGVTAEERAELTRLRRENRMLRTERELLKEAAAFFATGSEQTVSVYRFVVSEKAEFPSRFMYNRQRLHTLCLAT